MRRSARSETVVLLRQLLEHNDRTLEELGRVRALLADILELEAHVHVAPPHDHDTESAEEEP